MPDPNRIALLLEAVFGGDTPAQPLTWLQIAARAVAIYIIGIALIRLGKSRMLSRLSAADVLMGLVLGSLLSRGVTGNASMSGTTAACLALVGIHWLFTRIACHSGWFGNLVKGHGRVLVRDGQILTGALRTHHLTRHDLEEQMRLHGIRAVEEIEEAHKERSGEISMIKRRPSPQIVDVSVQPGVQTVRIELSTE